MKKVVHLMVDTATGQIVGAMVADRYDSAIRPGHFSWSHEGPDESYVTVEVVDIEDEVLFDLTNAEAVREILANWKLEARPIEITNDRTDPEAPSGLDALGIGAGRNLVVKAQEIGIPMRHNPGDRRRSNNIGKLVRK